MEKRVEWEIWIQFGCDVAVLSMSSSFLLLLVIILLHTMLFRLVWWWLSDCCECVLETIDCMRNTLTYNLFIVPDAACIVHMIV